MNLSSADLTSLVGSRICHDLISPLGAIANGIELLSMTGVEKTPEMTLISESVQNANARIKFFRVAYGAAKSNQQIGRGEILTILSDMSQGARVQYHWEPSMDCIRTDVRIAFLLIQCLESALAYGGDIYVGSNGVEWTVTARAHKMRIDDDLWQALLVGDASYDYGASEVHFALTPLVLASHGKKLAMTRDEGVIALTF